MLAVGERDIISWPKDRIRNAIHVPTGYLNTRYPERAFELENLSGKRCVVRRVADVVTPPWEQAWAGMMGEDARAEAIMRPSWSYVPMGHGFAQWARDGWLGVWDEAWWGWEHGRGWRAQRAAMKWLRSCGIPTRTWR